jgi:mono/diheme cytochrome c family protein
MLQKCVNYVDRYGRGTLNKGQAMKVLMTVIGTLVVLGVLGLLFVFSGMYDISAVTPHHPLTLWVLDKTLDNSVKHHAKAIQPPAPVNDSSVVAGGFRRFDQMCAGCHGAPGIQRRGSSKTYPAAPPLAAVAEDWTPAELFWIIRNGIKMSGMPAYGSNDRPDDDLWSIVAFVQKLPDITPEKYQALRAQRMQADSLRRASMPDSLRQPGRG